MAVRIDGNNDLINAADGTLTVEGISVNITGISTASGGYKVGTAYTVFPNGNVATAGIITATNLNLTGGSATITGSTATLHLVDENDNPNYRLQNNNGTFRIYDATNDTSRLNIDSSGNISVGTAATIKANGNATFSGIVTATSFSGTVPSSSLSGALPAIDGSNLTGLSANSISQGNSTAEILDTGTNGIFRFIPESSEVFRITHEAKVGINTNNPSHNLDISADGVAFPSAAGSTILRLRNSGGSATLSIDANAGNVSAIQFGDKDGASRGTVAYNHSTDSLNFNTDAVERARIASTGGIGINTEKTRNTKNVSIAGVTRDYTNSSTDLVDAGGIILQPTINLPSTGQAYPGIFWSGNTAALGRARAGIQGVAASNNDATDIVFLAKLNAGGAGITPADERMRIRNNGHVGIASDVPTVELDVIGDVHLGSKKFIFNGTSGHFGIYDSSTDTTPDNEIQIVTAQPQIRLEENSSGASKRLDLFVTSSGQPTIAANQSSQSIAFETTSAERFRITNDGVTFNGDTAAANALGDYEEGTYTAHFNIEGQGNMTMSGRVGLYVKIGQVVTVMGGGTAASVSGATSGTAIQFTNLPFPVHTTSSGVGHPFPVLMRNMDSTGLGNMSGNQPYSFIGRLFTDSDAGRLEAIRADGAQDPVNAGLAVASNTELHYMFTYITDA